MQSFLFIMPSCPLHHAIDAKQSCPPHAIDAKQSSSPFHECQKGVLIVMPKGPLCQAMDAEKSYLLCHGYGVVLFAMLLIQSCPSHKDTMKTFPLHQDTGFSLQLSGYCSPLCLAQLLLPKSSSAKLPLSPSYINAPLHQAIASKLTTPPKNLYRNTLNQTNFGTLISN